jgi:ABC-type Zn uptake system ZnuABC Zn-binding protein ZnuA
VPGGDPWSDPEQLAALKQQLKQALAEVEKQEQAVNEALRPHTVAEVDELQQKFQGALEELKGLRTELSKKEKENK